MELTLKRLEMETLHDFLDYFDHRAFLNDEDWAGCYCQAYLNPPGTKEEDVFGPGKARQHVCDRVAHGRMDGYLAYQDGQMVGWCAAGQSKLFEALPGAEEKLARIICFNIDPDKRGLGIAKQMLHDVIADLKERGFEAVEAAPLKSVPDDRSFRGTIEMFEREGFEKVTDLNEDLVLMRRYFD